jgi:hypothetical protein
MFGVFILRKMSLFGWDWASRKVSLHGVLGIIGVYTVLGNEEPVGERYDKRED